MAKKKKSGTKKSKVTKELRDVERIPFGEAVEVTFEEYRKFTVDYAENISQGGMFLRTQTPGQVGSQLDFRIKIRDIQREIAGRAVVVWTKELPGSSGMGLKFVHLEGDSANFIKDFINRHAVTEQS